MNSAIWESLDRMLTDLVGRLPFLLAAVLVLFIFWLLSRIVRRAFHTVSGRANVDDRLRILIGRLIAGATVFVGFLTALTVVIPSFEFANLVAGLGFTSFVVGFATRDILNNFLSGILILWQRPFHIGDYIFVGSNQGVVEYIGVRATTLRRDDGEIVLIPNGDMYSSALTIRGAGARRRMTLKFTVGYGSDLERAKAVAADSLIGTSGVIADLSPNVQVSELTGQGAAVTANFWIDTNESAPLDVFDRAAVNLLNGMRDSGIALFPGTTVQPEVAVEVPAVEDKKRLL